MPEDFPVCRIENNGRIMLPEETKFKGIYFHQYSSYKVHVKADSKAEQKCFFGSVKKCTVAQYLGSTYRLPGLKWWPATFKI